MIEELAEALGKSFRIDEEVWTGAHSGIATVSSLAGGASQRLRWIDADLLGKHSALEDELRGRLTSAVSGDELLGHDDIISVDGYLCILSAAPESPTLDIGDARVRDPRVALELGRTIAERLATIHDAGQVHGALSPASIHANVDTGSVVLADAGLAVGDEDLAKKLGCWACDPRYLSPEQARGEVGDQCADIFALGCIIVELLTGKPNVDGGTTAMVLYQKLYEDPLPADAESMPAPVRSLLEQLLSKDPGTRPADGRRACSVVDTALEELRAPIPSPPPAVSPEVDGTIVETSGVPFNPFAHDAGVVAGSGPTETPSVGYLVEEPSLFQRYGKQAALMAGAALIGAIAMSWLGGNGEESAPQLSDQQQVAGGPSLSSGAPGVPEEEGQGGRGTGGGAASEATTGAVTSNRGSPRSTQAPERLAAATAPPPQRRKAETTVTRAAEPEPVSVTPPVVDTTPTVREAVMREVELTPVQQEEKPAVQTDPTEEKPAVQADPSEEKPAVQADPAAQEPPVQEDPTQGVTAPVQTGAPPVGAAGEQTPPPDNAVAQAGAEEVAAPPEGAAQPTEEPVREVGEEASLLPTMVSDPDDVQEGDLVPFPDVVKPVAPLVMTIRLAEVGLRELSMVDRTVVTRLLIDENGFVLWGRVMRLAPDISDLALRDRLNEGIIAAMKTWRFEPATWHGIRVKVYTLVTLEGSVFQR